MPRRAARLALTAGVSLAVLGGCGATNVVPEHPLWADVAPILRGECDGCHGWTATDRPPDAAGVHPENTGGSYRFDFYDMTTDVCGDAALALDAGVTLAGAPAAPPQIAGDIVRRNGARWPRMPPQPSSALPDWEIETLQRWAADPAKGPPSVGNRPPTLAVSQLPSAVGRELAFTAIIDDPDGDAVLGVVELGGVAFLMNHSGAFAVRLAVPPTISGAVHPIAVVCDGWTPVTVDLGPIDVTSP